jgi:iron complex outermembrane receptor protein
MERLSRADIALALVLRASLFLAATPLRAQSPSAESDHPPLRSEITVVSRLGPDVTDVGVTVRVVTRREIDAMPFRTLPEVLQSIVGVDVRRRGSEGIQADIGIRGAGHDGTLILVDGEPVNDPQTNHFSADLDVPLDAVERIEVLSGGASALYGSGAVGGVVQIVTRGASLRRARAQVEGRYVHGSSSLDAGSVRLASRIGDSLTLAVDAARSESSGFRDDTEHQSKAIRLSASLDTGAGPLTLSLGYGGKEFGAYAFYGTLYPNQFESTRVRTARLASDLAIGGWTISPSVALRSHHDDFVLDRDRPSFYENLHDTETIQARLVARHPLLGGTLAAGGEAGRESIRSATLGDHDRGHQALFGEFARPLVTGAPDSGGVRLGLRWDQFEGFGSRLSPLASAWVAAGSFRFRASGSSAFRVPTFTDLYYKDPQTIGNPALEAETSWSAEAGATWTHGEFSVDLVGFVRHGDNLIDYVRTGPGIPFQAQNLRTIRTRGIEGTLDYRKREGGIVSRVALQAAYLTIELDDLSLSTGPIEGRYLLDPLHTKWDLIGSGVLPLQVSWRSRLSYQARPSFQNGVWLLDARLGRQLLEGEIAEVYVEADNIGDVSYEERPGTPLPGRRLAAGIHLTW